MKNQNGVKPYILYVEDDAEDVELLKFALAENKLDVEVVHVWNGAEALNYLEEFKQYQPLPSVIFLDINMQRLNGKETLVCLKADKDIARIPMAVLSTSTDKADMAYFGKFHIPYVVKPGDINKFKNDLAKVLQALGLEYNLSLLRKAGSA